jgi:hypothetical protein
MIKTIILSIALPLLGLVIMLTPASALAWNPFGGVDCGEAGNSAVCDRQKSGNPLAGPDGLIIKIANVVAIVAGIAAVIMIIYGGLKYVTSNGDSNSISSAKHTIIYALVGLVVIALAKIIITFVISRV